VWRAVIFASALFAVAPAPGHAPAAPAAPHPSAGGGALSHGAASIGVDTHLIHASAATRRDVLDSAAGLVVRESITWPGDDEDGPTDWSDTDLLAADVADAGAQLLPVLEPGPAGTRQAGRRARFARWVGEFCRRYRTPVIEVDNEPWNTGEWSATPAEYAAEVSAVVDELRGAPCRVIVSADPTEWDGPPWIARVLASAPGVWADPRIAGWSVHPYTAPYAPDASWLPARWSFLRYRRTLALAEAYAPGKPAYLTELGWRTTGPQAISQDARASYVDRALSIAQADPRVALAAVYKLEPSPTDGAAEAGFALTAPDGAATPALAVVRAHARISATAKARRAGTSRARRGDRAAPPSRSPAPRRAGPRGR
jgi:hypothetical protein